MFVLRISKVTIPCVHTLDNPASYHIIQNANATKVYSTAEEEGEPNMCRGETLNISLRVSLMLTDTMTKATHIKTNI